MLSVPFRLSKLKFCVKLINGFTCRVEVVTSFNNASGNAFFCILEVRTGVVNFLYANFAVNLEHAVIVLEEVMGRENAY